MKRALVLLVVLCAAAASTWAQTPARDLEASAAGSGGGSSSMPVNVINLPTDPTAVAVATTPTLISHRLIELIDVDVDVTTMPNPWYSEPFDTVNFTHYVIKTDGGEIEGGILACRLQWQLTPNGGFDQLYYITGDMDTRATGNLHNPTAKHPVNGLRGRVRCSVPTSLTGTLTNITVLLTRE